MKRWVFLALLVAGLVWLNGPGLRWIAPKVAAHFMGKAGMSGSFRMEGSLTGGLSIHDLKLQSRSTLAELSADRVAVSYRMGEVILGR